MAKTSRYTEDMPDIMLEAFKKGALPAEVPGLLGASKEDVLMWLRDNRKTEFRTNFKVGMAASEAFWAKMGLQAITGAFGKLFREKLYMSILQTQFGWSTKEKDFDKVENERIMTDDELDEKLAKLMAGSADGNVIPIASQVRSKPNRKQA